MKFSVNVSIHHLTNISFTFRKSTRKLVSSMEVKILLMKKKNFFSPTMQENVSQSTNTLPVNLAELVEGVNDWWQQLEKPVVMREETRAE